MQRLFDTRLHFSPNYKTDLVLMQKEKMSPIFMSLAAPFVNTEPIDWMQIVAQNVLKFILTANAK